MSSKSVLLWLALAGLFVGGCASQPAINGSANAAPALPVTPRELEALAAGSYCEVELFSDSPNSSTTCTGRVVGVDGERLTLDELQITGRSIHRVPVLGDVPIPAVQRMFRNTGIGRELVDGEKTFPREQIAAITRLDAQTAAWYASRRNAGKSQNETNDAIPTKMAAGGETTSETARR